MSTDCVIADLRHDAVDQCLASALALALVPMWSLSNLVYLLHVLELLLEPLT